ncbi:hypothetical protein O6P43_032252 [Quillaja saponaria]|uniref:Uncharacterized protein n=1 Tax=Quillaja saponaria TaxID=32244 RepID=A0AAD7KNA0_QUISA|nr:hypothetical protein O6P43_032252 [Quillaja saponaria]
MQPQHEVNPLAPVHQDWGVFVMLQDFRKMQQQRFSGVDPAQDPYAFLEESNRLCIALGCDPVHMVELAVDVGYRLKTKMVERQMEREGHKKARQKDSSTSRAGSSRRLGGESASRQGSFRGNFQSGRGQAQVYALKTEDAQASNAMVSGDFSRTCNF